MSTERPPSIHGLSVPRHPCLRNAHRPGLGGAHAVRQDSQTFPLCAATHAPRWRCGDVPLRVVLRMKKCLRVRHETEDPARSGRRCRPRARLSRWDRRGTRTSFPQASLAAYRRAISPPAERALIASGPSTTNLPSPCRTGRSMSESPLVHTQRLFCSNLTLTQRSSYFPESLWIRETSCAPLPSRLGRAPILTSTWNPLQIPSTRPPPATNSPSSAPSVRRNNVAKTFPEPR